MKNEQQKLLAVKVPMPVWAAMEDRYERTGLSRADMTRSALMVYLGITDLRMPFVPTGEVKDMVIASV